MPRLDPPADRHSLQLDDVPLLFFVHVDLTVSERQHEGLPLPEKYLIIASRAVPRSHTAEDGLTVGGEEL